MREVGSFVHESCGNARGCFSDAQEVAVVNRSQLFTGILRYWQQSSSMLALRRGVVWLRGRSSALFEDPVAMCSEESTSASLEVREVEGT